MGYTRKCKWRPASCVGRTHRGARCDGGATLELAISAGSRTTPSGELLRWRLAGLERAEAEPSLPFFMEWAEGTPFPGRAGREQEIVRLELTADPERIAGWL